MNLESAESKSPFFARGFNAHSEKTAKFGLGARHYNFSALTAPERIISEHREVAEGAIRAIVKTQKTLKANPAISTEVGERLFPADEAQLIAGLIERDAPFYDAEISHDAVDGLMNFATGYGLIKDAVPYEDLVATQFSHLWKE